QIHRVHELAADFLQPARELIEAYLVRLRRVPGEVETPRAVRARPDTIFPAVPRDEITSGVSDRAHTELLDERDHVAPVPLLVGVGVRRLVDAVVDASSEVLDEGAEEPAIDWPHDKMRVDGETRGDQRFL